MAMEDGIRVMWNIPFFDIPVTNVVVMSWICMAIIILWAFVSTRKLKLVPTGLQNTAEIAVETMNNFSENIIGHTGRKFAPYLGTIGAFLALANTLGALFMSELTGGLVAPTTRGLAIPVALAFMTIILVIGAGIQKKGIVGFIKSLFKARKKLFHFII